MNLVRRKIIVDMIFGSFVYGTNTPNSDMDYKGIYMAPVKDIIFNKRLDSIVTCIKVKKGSGIRNTKDDIDHELKELRKFISDALDGQTYAVDMLYTPGRFWVTSSPEWEFIIQNRYRFLSKHINAFIGYCNQQASKYGLKGTRLGTVAEAIRILKTYPHDSRLEDNPRLPTNDYLKYIFYEHHRNNEIVNEEMLEILGKKFSFRTQIKLIIPALQKFYDLYGERAALAMENKGLDCKAVSHAYRCCYQLIELATEHRVSFPLAQAPYLTEIKTGKISWPEVIQDELPLLMEEAINKVKSSDLPDEPDKEFWDDFIYQTYLRYIKETA